MRVHGNMRLSKDQQSFMTLASLYLFKTGVYSSSYFITHVLII